MGQRDTAPAPYAGLLHLLQIADSAFPTGAFAHSLGLETLVQEGWLGPGSSPAPAEAEQALERLLAARLAMDLAHVDLPILLEAYGVCVAGRLHELAALDDLAAASKPVREWCAAGAGAGRRLLLAVYDFEAAPQLAAMMHVRESGPQLCVAFAIAGQLLGCGAAETAHAFAAGACSGQLSAALRLGLIGQRSVQRVRYRLNGAIEAAVGTAMGVKLEDIGGCMPLLEIAGMRHEYAVERLFVS